MKFDEIISWVSTWATVFDGFIDLISTSIGDIVGSDSLWSAILPNTIKDATIFGLLFASSFSIYVGVTLWKWGKETFV